MTTMMTDVPTDIPDIVGNYFSEARYFNTDVKTGVTRNRGGTRILALTDDFLLGFWEGFEEECGEAAGPVMKTCGKFYGARMAGRFARDLESHYGTPVALGQVAMFEANLSECMAIHGWGRLTIDWNSRDRGLIIVRVPDAPFAQVLDGKARPMDFLLAGILAGIFSDFAGQPLDCAQTESPAQGAGTNTFVIGLAERLADVDEWVTLGLDHAGCMAKLLNPQADV